MPPASDPTAPSSGLPAAIGPSTPQAIDSVAVALGRIPSGLYVVTWREGESDRAMLASWVIQAGFAPPAISLAVAASRDLLAAIDRGASFVVTILGESQRSLLGRFGKPAAPGEDPFAGLEIVRSAGGAAGIGGSAGWLECRAVSRAAAADHVIIVAEVLSGDSGPATSPLVHLRKNGLRY